jgi:hypothetical protein
MEECGPCPVFASFNLAFALQLKKSTEKPQTGKPENANWHFKCKSKKKKKPAATIVTVQLSNCLPIHFPMWNK